MLLFSRHKKFLLCQLWLYGNSNSGMYVQIPTIGTKTRNHYTKMYFYFSVDTKYTIRPTVAIWQLIHNPSRGKCANLSCLIKISRVLQHADPVRGKHFVSSPLYFKPPLLEESCMLKELLYLVTYVVYTIVVITLLLLINIWHRILFTCATVVLTCQV